MPAGVLDRLRELNPKNEHGNRSRKHHQHLADDVGVTHLEGQIQQVIALMKASDDKDQFDRLFNKATKRDSPVQQMLEF